MRILILGGNGMIGHKLYQVLSKKFPETWVLFRKNISSIKYSSLYNKNYVIDNFEITKFSKLNKLLNDLNVDVIINSIGLTIRRNVYDVYSNSILINSVLPNYLNEWVVLNNKRLIHFSTDCVFSGKDGFYTEKSLRDAIDFYGRSKALGEVDSPNTLTLRGSMVGRELENKTELLEWFISNKNGVVTGYRNALYSGITTNCMAEFVSNIIENFPNLNGLYNVSSEIITKLDLLTLFNQYFEVNATIKPDDSFTTNKVLNSEKFYTETGFRKPNWEELVQDLENDSRNYIYLYD